MNIYIDESKKLAKWQIVIWGFITKHSNNFVNKYIYEKKKEYWFKNCDLELKSVKNTGKIFYENMIFDDDFSIIFNNIIWINIEWYFKDEKEKYIEIIWKLIWKIYIWIKTYKKDIYIISDNLYLDKNNKKVEKEINNFLNKKYPLYKGYKFLFVNSKWFWWVQLADLISYELRLSNINKNKIFDDFIQNNNFNINLYEIIKI